MNKPILLFICALIITACSTDNKLCIDRNSIDLSLVPDSIYKPVCGCDNNTYYNRYEAEYLNGVRHWKTGQCDHKCTYTDTLTMFASNDSCIILTDYSNFYEVAYAPDGIIWELNQPYFVNYFESNIKPLCVGEYSINITCIKPFTPDCFPILNTLDIDNFLPNDTLQIDSIVLLNPCIKVYYSYLGGCNNERLDLFHLSDSSTTNNIRLQLRFDLGDGPCDEIINDSISFDLSPIQIDGMSEVSVTMDANGDSNFLEQFIYSYK